jgi:HEAT repeat protein
MILVTRLAFCWAVALSLLGLSESAACAAEGEPAIQEAELIETLRSGAPADKAITCKKLAIYGTKDAIPDLAKLLSDEQLASWARIALEAIPDKAADAALVEAAKTLQGRLLVGTINSIGVRRSEGAVEQLADRLADRDAEVASAAAVALGRIGDGAAIKTLRSALGTAAPGVRSAVAEGCILCAERLLADGDTAEAAAIYDEVRAADLPQPRLIEATRGAILARQGEGLPLLVELFKSPDEKFFRLGLTVAREMPGEKVADALVAELSSTAPNRAALLLDALADRPHAALLPAIAQAAESGDKRVRLASLAVIGRLGDAANVPALLAMAAEDDADVAEAAKAALAELSGEEASSEIAGRLLGADGDELAIVLDIVGRRRIAATPALLKALDRPEPEIRRAALVALGETIAPQDLHVLISRVLNATGGEDEESLGQALKAAAIRMPDREATAAALAAAIPDASTATKSRLVRILGAMGGSTALEAIAATAKDGDEQMYDVASRVLGEWMTVDAAPALLRLAKDPANKKYQVRALRGYIRLVRQFEIPEDQRASMCRDAFEAAVRPDEQRLVLAVLERYPSLEALAVAVQAGRTPAVKADAARAAKSIAHELGEQRADVQEALRQGEGTR